MRIGGKIEVFTPRSVNGWISVFGGPSERPGLELLLDGITLATATAEQFRPDVAAKGLGDGLCQFQIVLPAPLTDAEFQRVRLRVVGSEVFLELPRAARQASGDVVDAIVGPATPVFVVGSPRSGTSVLTRALAAAGYHGYEEGNLLGLAQLVDQQVDWYYEANDASSPGTLLGNVSRQALKESLFQVFKDTLERLNPVAPWFDKTGNPETIALLPRIMASWPGCRVIFARRRGIENVSSRVLKFPERDFAYHCRDWAANMRAWRLVRGQLDGSRITEIDQQDMLDQTEMVANGLSILLGLSERATDTIRQVFATERPQESFPGSAGRTLRLSTSGWSELEVEIFQQYCYEEMVAYGYSEE